ncbi:MAG: HEPN domain-containing protein [Caldilineaceae bacterium]|nr:HEPN domain-containing protein [Caldilineaceae bacterium]
MSSTPLHELLRYRMEQAYESLRDANTLFATNSLRGAINRAYYAMFYALLALIATKRLGSSKHSGAIASFDREFVKTGIFPRDLSKALHLAFDRRQVHDYGELIAVDDDVVEQALQDADKFVATVETYLRELGYPL